MFSKVIILDNESENFYRFFNYFKKIFEFQFADYDTLKFHFGDFDKVKDVKKYFQIKNKIKRRLRKFENRFDFVLGSEKTFRVYNILREDNKYYIAYSDEKKSYLFLLTEDLKIDLYNRRKEKFLFTYGY